ncbi:MAG: serine dehydratase beta chain [Lachnospira eligens]
MVGPSSSHTAGAVRIVILRKTYGRANCKSRNPFIWFVSGNGEKGHGTRKALVAGLLGMKPDDMRIPDSLRLLRSMA